MRSLDSIQRDQERPLHVSGDAESSQFKLMPWRQTQPVVVSKVRTATRATSGYRHRSLPPSTRRQHRQTRSGESRCRVKPLRCDLQCRQNSRGHRTRLTPLPQAQEGAEPKLDDPRRGSLPPWRRRPRLRCVQKARDPSPLTPPHSRSVHLHLRRLTRSQRAVFPVDNVRSAMALFHTTLSRFCVGGVVPCCPRERRCSEPPERAMRRRRCPATATSAALRSS